MRKLFIITTLFSCGCLLSQTKKEEKAKVEVLPVRTLSPHIRTKLDTTKILGLRQEDSNSRFYKNITDEKASQYTMLKKIIPSYNYQTQNAEPLKIDTLQNLNKIKPQGK